MNSLPTLRRKIVRSFSILTMLYAGLGLFLVLCVFLASGTTPQMIHRNYDSIGFVTEMRESWNALGQPERYPQRTRSEWARQLERGLQQEEHNITEQGESEIVQKIRGLWEKNRALEKIPQKDFQRLNALLSDLVLVNENGMFHLAHGNAKLSREVLVGTIIYFLLSLILAFFVADGLSTRLSSPLKNIAEALHRRPRLGSRLKLIEPTSIEILILTTELKRLWDRVSEAEKVNVTELVQQKRKLETVLESVEDGLLVLDAEGKVSHCNKCMLELLALPEEKVLRHQWVDLPTVNENYLKLRSALEEEMADSHEVELQFHTASRQFAARQRKILGAAEQPIATLFLLHDITEQRQRDRFRTEVIDLLSHEIKTPLQSLGTATELLAAQKENLPNPLKPLVDTIMEDVERIRAVAGEFVQVTQSHSKIMKFKLETLALNQYVPEWIRPFKIVAKDRNVHLEFRQEGSPVILAQIDSVKFPWVLSNLLSNAIRFAPAGGVVQVFLTDRNHGVEIEVTDDGPGISEEDQRKMFSPFFQGVEAVASGKRGLFGIGLTIAKEVVEAHDGRILYERVQPHGSRFRIILPAAPTAHA